jgi:hypothetical protein
MRLEPVQQYEEAACMESELMSVNGLGVVKL